MATISIEEETARGPGWARITVRPRPTAPAPRLRLSRRQSDKPYLGPQGWQSSPQALEPQAIISDETAGVFLLGPEITRHLELDDRVEIAVDGTPIQARVEWPYITPRVGMPAGTLIRPADPEPPVAPPPTTKPPELPPEPEPKPEPPPQPPRSPPPLPAAASRRCGPRCALLIALAALVLVVAGGLLWYLVQEDRTVAEASIPPEEPAPVAPLQAEPEPEPAPTPPTEPAPLSFAERLALYRGEEDHARELYLLAQEARDGGDVEVAIDALSLAAQRSSPEANLDMGRRYDPGIAGGGEREFAPQPLSAARYYCRAIALGAAGADDLLADLKSRAAAPPREEAELFHDFPPDYECST